MISPQAMQFEENKRKRGKKKEQRKFKISTAPKVTGCRKLEKYKWKIPT
jgi:hypothetical protein